MSVTISKSYIDAATSLGANPKQTPQSVALKTDASRKNLKASLNNKKTDKHLASHQNLETIKHKTTKGDFFADGWNF